MPMFNNVSLRTKLILIFLAVILFTSSSISLLSYLAAENTIEEKSEELIYTSLNQAVKRLDLFMQNVHRASMSITFNKDLKKIINAVDENNFDDYYYMQRVMDSISTFNNINGFIDNFSIYDFRHSIIISSKSTKSIIDTTSTEYKIIKELLLENPDSFTIVKKWIETRKINLFGRDRLEFTFIMPIKQESTTSIIGCVAAYIDEEQISDIFKEMRIPEDSSIILVNASGKVLSARNKTVIGMDMSNYLQPYKAGDSVSYVKKVDGKKYIITYMRTKYTDWGFLSIIPLNSLMEKNMVVFKSTFILICIVTIIIAFFISFLFNFYFYKPIKYLINRIKLHAAEENPVVHLFSRNDEIGFIFKSFNEIFLENRNLMKNVYEQKLHLKDSEIRLLHSQINPHFLYNSLDVITWMAKFGKNEEVIKLLKVLTKFFRTSLDKGNEIVTVEEVKEQVESYFVIQKARFANKLNVEIDIDPLILKYKMLKLLLQPVVENSIHHGIEKKIGESFIKVTGKSGGDFLVFTVEDNGVGVSPERLEEVNAIIDSEQNDPGNFSALQNINRRIKLFFGNDYGIKIDSCEGKGTIVIMEIPVMS